MIIAYILNFFAILLFCIVCVVFQSTLLHEWFGIYKPNLLLIVICYLALNRFPIEGAILSYLGGYLLELNSAGAFGLYSIVMTLAFLSAKLFSEGFFIKSLPSQMAFVFVTSFVFKAFFILILSIYKPLHEIFEMTMISVFPMAFLNVILTPIFFLFLTHFDEWCSKEPPSKTGTQEAPVRFREEM